MRFVLFALALCLSGCGGCVEDSSDTPQQQPGTDQPSKRSIAVGSAKVLPRFAQLPVSAPILDAGAGDE